MYASVFALDSHPPWATYNTQRGSNNDMKSAQLNISCIYTYEDGDGDDIDNNDGENNSANTHFIENGSRSKVTLIAVGFCT